MSLQSVHNLKATYRLRPYAFVECLTLFRNIGESCIENLIVDLLRDANDSACWTGSGIASGLALLMTALAQIIRASMNDNCTAQYALRSNQLDQWVGDRSLRVSLIICLEISKVTNVAVVI